MDMRINLLERLGAMRFALAGLATLFRTQANAWIYLVLTMLLVVAGILVGLEAQQWIWILLSITLVWITELLNTAVEFTCDLVTREQNELVKFAKDTAAAAVFLAAAMAVVVIAWVFWTALQGPLNG
jgi:undecaprenol kinase